MEKDYGQFSGPGGDVFYGHENLWEDGPFLIVICSPGFGCFVTNRTKEAERIVPAV
jgi:hypothetical protein